MTQAEQPLNPLLTLLQLGRRARDAASVEALGFVMVNETLRLLPYRQAAFWVGGGLGRVAAVSGLAQADGNTPYIQWLTLLSRSLQKRPEQKAGGESLTAASAGDALAADWSAWLPAHLLWLPLRKPDGQFDGALLLARDTPWQEHELALANELGHSYAHALAAFAPRETLKARARALLKPTRNRKRLLVAALVACLFPVRLTVLAPAEVAPTDPFVVRAPLDGIVDGMQVRPNQPVKAGTPLFKLDPTTLRSRYELARKAQDTALEEYRQAAQLAVTDDKGKLEMTQTRGRLAEKDVELEFTSEQLNRIQVRAERDGIAVFSDVNDWVGKAVNVGERVMTLADPAKVELTAYLPVANSIDIGPGSELTFYPNNSPLSSFDAQVVNLAYSAETTPEGVLAYRVRARLDQGESKPRLGLMGTAKLKGSWVPLAYYVLRRPLTGLRQRLGW